MADETLGVSHGLRSVILAGAGRIKPTDYDILTLSVGGNTAKAGHIVTIAGETYPNCDLAILTDEHAYAVILEPVYPDNMTDYTIDTLITDGELVRVLKLGRSIGCTVALILEALAGPIAAVPGHQLVIGLEAGKIRVFLYADGTSEKDTLQEQVGVCAEADAGSAADDHILPVII